MKVAVQFKSLLDSCEAVLYNKDKSIIIINDNNDVVIDKPSTEMLYQLGNWHNSLPVDGTLMVILNIETLTVDKLV